MKDLKSVLENNIKEKDHTKIGEIQLYLREYMDAHQITRNALAISANVTYKTVDRYYKNENIQSVDINLLTKFCYCMSCDLSDIIKYIPPK